MAKKNFEESLKKLEQITHDLEEGDLNLDESLKMFDEGMKLAEYCNEKLNEAQQKVQLLLNRDGKPTPQPFPPADEE